MNQEFTVKSGISNLLTSGIFYLMLVLCFFNSILGLKAQNYVQVPPIGGVISPSYPQVPYFGPISSLNVRAASLYKASDFINLPAGVQITSLGYKLSGPTSGGSQGGFNIYIIPTTDTYHNLSSNWNTIQQHSDIIEVCNCGFMAFSPITGYLNFNLTTPFTLQPGQGFYLVTDWDQGILPGIIATYECNNTLSSSQYFGTNNSHMPQTPPSSLNQSSNYRHVLRLGYAGGVTGVSGDPNSKEMSIYPNPAQEVLHIDLGKFNGSKVQVTLRDVTGKVVKTESLKNKENQISLMGIVPGIYSLHLASGSETLVKRIVIE